MAEHKFNCWTENFILSDCSLQTYCKWNLKKSINSLWIENLCREEVEVAHYLQSVCRKCLSLHREINFLRYFVSWDQKGRRPCNSHSKNMWHLKVQFGSWQLKKNKYIYRKIDLFLGGPFNLITQQWPWHADLRTAYFLITKVEMHK